MFCLILLQIELIITNCNKDEWTCDSGDCIPRDERCDLTEHCDDFSDEFNCNEFILFDGYDKESNPPTQANETFELKMAINITGIKVVDLASFTITVDMIQTIMWYDRRILLRLLKNIWTHVEFYDNIWIPEFYIEDGTSSSADIETGFEMLRIKREGGTLPKNLESIIQGKFFFRVTFYY